MIIVKKISNRLTKYVKKTSWYNNCIFEDCSKFWNLNTFNLDVVNLGSTSGVHAFDYSEVDVRGMNWAVSRNPILGDQEILNNYISYLKRNNSVVILTLCPFTSLSGSYDDFDDRYYTFLKFASIPNCSLRRKNRVLDIKDRPLKYYPLFSFLSDILLFHVNKHDKQMSEIEMEEDANGWIKGWMHEFSISDFNYPLSMVNRDGIEDSNKIITEIIKYCKVNSIRPVIVIPPVYHTLGKKFTPKIRKIVIETLINKLNDSSVWFHNYMDDEDFNNDRSLFVNSFLMNKKGARLFTKRVLKDIGMI